MSPLRILLVEDNPGDADLLRRALLHGNLLPHALEHVEELEDAVSLLVRERFDLVLLDLSLPDSRGLETFLELHARAPDVPVVVLTGLADEALAVRTVHEGAQDYLVKADLDGKLLARAIRYAVERHRLVKSEREKGEQLQVAIREAHHRIKNNLQAISDLLYLEFSAGSGSSAREALRESIERIQAIALVHDLLSQHEDVQTVDLRSVLERLVPMTLASSSRFDPSAVELSIDVPPVRVSAKKGTTLCLIVNELVSNAAKHAFSTAPAGSTGHRLAVSLRADCEDLVLRVQDSGPGLRDGFDLDADSRVGLQVVRVMAERDLGGRLTLTSEGGLRAEVRFRW